MKPKVTCFMMSSINGRIDCAMTELIDGSDEYYDILNELNFDVMVSGKTTAIMHYAKDDKYTCKSDKIVGKKVFYKAGNYSKYTLITDTLGVLTWEGNDIDGSHLIVALSENAKEEYLAFLKSLNISYIVTGKNSIDLKDLLEVLNVEFGIQNVGVVGGGKINGSFLKEGLIDKIALLIGPGIDARSNQPNLFDGFDSKANPINLKLDNCKVYSDGGVYLTYIVK